MSTFTGSSVSTVNPCRAYSRRAGSSMGSTKPVEMVPCFGEGAVLKLPQKAWNSSKGGSNEGSGKR